MHGKITCQIIPRGKELEYCRSLDMTYSSPLWLWRKWGKRKCRRRCYRKKSVQQYRIQTKVNKKDPLSVQRILFKLKNQVLESSGMSDLWVHLYFLLIVRSSSVLHEDKLPILPLYLHTEKDYLKYFFLCSHIQCMVVWIYSAFTTNWHECLTFTNLVII